MKALYTCGLQFDYQVYSEISLINHIEYVTGLILYQTLSAMDELGKVHYVQTCIYV